MGPCPAPVTPRDTPPASSTGADGTETAPRSRKSPRLQSAFSLPWATLAPNLSTCHPPSGALVGVSYPLLGHKQPYKPAAVYCLARVLWLRNVGAAEPAGWFRPRLLWGCCRGAPRAALNSSLWVKGLLSPLPWPRRAPSSSGLWDHRCAGSRLPPPPTAPSRSTGTKPGGLGFHVAACGMEHVELSEAGDVDSKFNSTSIKLT